MFRFHFAVAALLLAGSVSAQQIGRYVALPLGTPGTQEKSNFIWVLDTATGAITSHRIASASDAHGETLFIIQEVPSEAEAREYVRQQQAERQRPRVNTGE